MLSGFPEEFFWLYAVAESDTGEIRYIGSTCDPRQRESEHNSMTRGRARKSQWAAGVRGRGANLVLLALRRFDSEHAALVAERAAILTRRSMGIDLVNTKVPFGRPRRTRRQRQPHPPTLNR